MSPNQESMFMRAEKGPLFALVMINDLKMREK